MFLINLAVSKTAGQVFCSSSIWIWLTFSAWLDWGYGFRRRMPERWTVFPITSYQEAHDIPWQYTMNLNFYSRSLSTVNLLFFSLYLINTIWRDASISCEYPILIIYLLILTGNPSTGICWWFLLAKVGVYLKVIIFLIPSTVIIWNSSVKKPSFPLIYLYNHLFMWDSWIFRELSLFSNIYRSWEHWIWNQTAWIWACCWLVAGQW